MMETWQAFQHILFWVFMGLMWWSWIEYRKFSTDKTRQRLFAIRDDLFMSAVQGYVASDSEAYLLMRELLNGAIRYANRLTIFRVAMVKAAMERHGIENRFSTQLAAEMKVLDADQKKILGKALRATDEALIHHLARSNLLMLAFVEIINTMHLTNKMMTRWKVLLKNTKRVINNDILIDEGMVMA